MSRRPPVPTRTDILYPYTTRFRSLLGGIAPHRQRLRFSRLSGLGVRRGFIRKSVESSVVGVRSVHGRFLVRSWWVGGSGVSVKGAPPQIGRHTSELQSLMRISYAVFCLKKKNKKKKHHNQHITAENHIQNQSGVN